MIYYCALMCLSFFEPILADKLSASFHYDSDEVAYFYARFTFSCLASNTLMIFVPWKGVAALYACMGLFSGGVGCFLMAPEGLLQMATTPSILTAGLVCLGFGCEFLLNVSTVSVVGSLNDVYPGRTVEVGKLFARLRLYIAGSSFLASPFLASLLTQLSSYETTCSAVGSILLLLCFCYGTQAIYFYSKKKRSQTKKKDKLLALKEPLLSVVSKS